MSARGVDDTGLTVLGYGQIHGLAAHRPDRFGCRGALGTLRHWRWRDRRSGIDSAGWPRATHCYRNVIGGALTACQPARCDDLRSSRSGQVPDGGTVGTRDSSWNSPRCSSGVRVARALVASPACSSARDVGDTTVVQTVRLDVPGQPKSSWGAM
jgi:hypothetical protein